MIRGTTPTHIYNIPFDPELIQSLRIIYVQNDEMLFVKERKDCIVDGRQISVKLTQEETLMMDAAQLVEIQMRVLTTGGDALASKPKKVAVGRLLEDEVIK